MYKAVIPPCLQLNLHGTGPALIVKKFATEPGWMTEVRPKRISAYGTVTSATAFKTTHFQPVFTVKVAVRSSIAILEVHSINPLME